MTNSVNPYHTAPNPGLRCFIGLSVPKLRFFTVTLWLIQNKRGILVYGKNWRGTKFTDVPAFSVDPRVRISRFALEADD